MQTVLSETLRTHIEMITIALAIHDNLEKSAKTSAVLNAAAVKLGVDHIVLEQPGISFRSGDIFVVKDGQTLAQFTVSKNGELKHWPWEVYKDKTNAA